MSDFSNVLDSGGLFVQYEEDTGVDFFAIGDAGVIIIGGSGWGEAPWGEEPWGGEGQIIIDSPTTIWTNINSP